VNSWILAKTADLTSRSYPPDTPEKQQALGKFFGEFPPPKIAGYVPDYVDALKAHSPAVSKLAMLGVSLSLSWLYS
jgi:hypothetical protein